MNIMTNRLYLREAQIEDAELIYKELGCNTAITKYTGWNPYTTLEVTKKKVAKDINRNGIDSYSWVIFCKKDMIGTIGAYDYNAKDASIEIGYSMFESFWNNGYATEATKAVVSFLVNQRNIHRISAWSHVENIASRKLLEKIGFVQERMEDEIITYKFEDSIISQ